MSDTHKEHFITSHDGIKLYFREYGNQFCLGAPIICLPGLTRNSKDFQIFAKKYCNNHRILCLDLRGRGKSGYDKNKKNYGRPGIFAQDVFSIAASTNISKAIFVGTSLGGLLCMQMAVMKPTLVKAVILNDIGPELPTEAVEKISKQTGQRETFINWNQAIKKYKQKYLEYHPEISDEKWEQTTKNTYAEKNNIIGTDYDLHIIKEVKQTRTEFNLWQLFEALNNIPTIAIRGEFSDVLTEDTFLKMKKKKQDLIQVTVPKCGHNPFLDEIEVTDAIDKLISDIEK